MYCQHCLTPCIDLVSYYCRTSDSYLSICHLYSCDLIALNVSASFEWLQVLSCTLFCDLLGSSCTEPSVDSHLRQLHWQVTSIAQIRYPSVPIPIPILGCPSTTVIVLPKWFGLTMPEPPVLFWNCNLWTPSIVSEPYMRLFLSMNCWPHIFGSNLMIPPPGIVTGQKPLPMEEDRHLMIPYSEIVGLSIGEPTLGSTLILSNTVSVKVRIIQEQTRWKDMHQQQQKQQILCRSLWFWSNPGLRLLHRSTPIFRAGKSSWFGGLSVSQQ